MEPISPELALIDPELARAHIAWLELSPEILPATPSPAARAAERRRSVVRITPSWPTAAKFVAALSLAANGFLTAVLVAHDHPKTVALRPAAAIPIPDPPAAPGVSTSAATSPDANAAIEQKVLSLVFQSASSRLPRTLVDAHTGLPKNNLQAVCRAGRSGSHVCVVRPARHRPGEGLYVRYTPAAGGRGSFTWFPYRTG